MQYKYKIWNIFHPKSKNGRVSGHMYDRAYCSDSILENGHFKKCEKKQFVKNISDRIRLSSAYENNQR